MIMIRIDGFAYLYTSLDTLLDAIAENAYDSRETGGEDGIYEAEPGCGNHHKKLIELRKGGRKMSGTYEQRIRSLMLEGRDPIEINWINLTLGESEDGGADRVTEMLVAAGYRPDIKTVGAVVPDLQLDYAYGRRVNGKYIRLPQETWHKTAARHAMADAEQVKEALKTLGISGKPRLEHVSFRTYRVFIGRDYQGTYDCDRETFVD